MLSSSEPKERKHSFLSNGYQAEDHNPLRSCNLARSCVSSCGRQLLRQPSAILASWEACAGRGPSHTESELTRVTHSLQGRWQNATPGAKS